MDDIMSGDFSKTMMQDWENDDKNLLAWRSATAETSFEKHLQLKIKLMSKNILIRVF